MSHPSHSAVINTNPTIRYATQADVPDILALIHELADYEHAASSVEATEEKLLATLSFPVNDADSSPAEQPAFTAGYARTFLIYPAPPSTSSAATDPPLPAPSAPEAAGLALFFPNYSTWLAQPGIYLEDLYIRPRYRRRGYASLLFRALGKEVQRMGGGRLDWSVLKWNVDARRFYEGEGERGIGAVAMEEWVGMRVEGRRGLERLVGDGGGDAEGGGKDAEGQRGEGVAGACRTDGDVKAGGRYTCMYLPSMTGHPATSAELETRIYWNEKPVAKEEALWAGLERVVAPDRSPGIEGLAKNEPVQTPG